MHLFLSIISKNTSIIVRSLPQSNKQHSSHTLWESCITNQRNFSFCSCYAQPSLTILMSCTLFLKWMHFAVVCTLLWLMIICRSGLQNVRGNQSGCGILQCKLQCRNGYKERCVGHQPLKKSWLVSQLIIPVYLFIDTER